MKLGTRIASLAVAVVLVGSSVQATALAVMPARAETSPRQSVHAHCGVEVSWFDRWGPSHWIAVFSMRNLRARTNVVEGRWLVVERDRSHIVTYHVELEGGERARRVLHMNGGRRSEPNIMLRTCR
jgi:hypothetical protein